MGRYGAAVCDYEVYIDEQIGPSGPQHTGARFTLTCPSTESGWSEAALRVAPTGTFVSDTDAERDISTRADEAAGGGGILFSFAKKRTPT